MNTKRIISTVTTISAMTVVAAIAVIVVLAGGSDTAGRTVGAEPGTTYHALLIANNQMAGDNDKFKTAMLNWNSWKDNSDNIIVKDNRTGKQIVADIDAWVTGIDGDDVAVFYYSGHGGMRKDEGGDERDNDPVWDNDQKRKQDEVIGTLAPRRFSNPARDDEVKAALGALPSGTTLLAIFDMCHANGEVLGTLDVDVLINVGVLTSTSEAGAAFFAGGNGMIWSTKLVKGLFDGGDVNTNADADTNPKDGKITAQEFAAWAESQDSATNFTSNLAGAADRPIFTGLNNEQTAPGNATGNKKGGEEGSGDCSDPDCGDLPDSYKTLIASDGPCYNEFTLQRLGTAVDSEEDGQPSPNADGDDKDPEGDDEDGVAFSSSSVDVTVTIDHPDPNDYRLDAWWDLDENGVFDEASEHIINSQVAYNNITGGLHLDLVTGSYEFNYPLGFDPRDFNSRFRLTFGIDTSITILSFGEYDAGDGGSHGEVEDYGVGGTEPPDTPDPKPESGLRVPVDQTFPCAGGPVAGKVCVPLGATFDVIVVADSAPTTNGYILAQGYIAYDTAGLVQKKTDGPLGPTTNATMIWPDGEAATFLKAQFLGVPATSVGALTALLPPQPPSFYKGDLFSIELTCTTSQSTSQIRLLPSGDPVAGTSGTLFIEFGTGAQLIPNVTGLTVNCNPGPTATPTATPPPIPRMSTCDQADNDGDTIKDFPDCSNLVNVFLTRQSIDKIPPGSCLSTKGTTANVGALAEKLQQTIVSPDPKDPSAFQQLAAFEFEVHYDNKKVCVDINVGAAFEAAGAVCIIEDDQPDSKPQLEGVARIGCVTIGKGHGIDELVALASVDVYPQPEIYSQAKPNQDNGVVVQINNVNCDLSDEQGHAIPVFSCDDADITFRYLEGDVEPDCVIDAMDAQAIAFRWGVEKGSLIYKDFMNVEPSSQQQDNDIDINDLQFVFGRFGSTCEDPHPPQPPVNPKA